MEYETIKMEKSIENPTVRDEYSEKFMTTPPRIAVFSCEGSCVRGEIARRAANLIAFRISPDETVRICLTNAFSRRDRGMRKLVERAETVIAFEGCQHNCSSRMMKAVVPDMKAEIIRIDEIFKEKVTLENYPDELLTVNAGIAADLAMQRNLILKGSSGHGK